MPNPPRRALLDPKKATKRAMLSEATATLDEFPSCCSADVIFRLSSQYTSRREWREYLKTYKPSDTNTNRLRKILRVFACSNWEPNIFFGRLHSESYSPTIKYYIHQTIFCKTSGGYLTDKTFQALVDMEYSFKWPLELVFGATLLNQGDYAKIFFASDNISGHGDVAHGPYTTRGYMAWLEAKGIAVVSSLTHDGMKGYVYKFNKRPTANAMHEAVQSFRSHVRYVIKQLIGE